MKQLLFICSILFTLNLIGQNIIISEDFNAGIPAGWQMIDNDGLTANSDASVSNLTGAFFLAEDPDSLGLGDSVLIATSWFDTIGTADNFLILPITQMASFGNYISFDAKSLDASYPESLEIRISKGGTNVWDFFTDNLAYANEAIGPYWNNYTVCLDSANATSENVFIAIRHIGTDNYILAIDNIMVWTEDPVSMSNPESLSFEVSPNPSTEFINLNIEVAVEYEIVSITGEVVRKGTYNRRRISLSNLPSGVYFINAAGYKVKKIIKQ